VQSVQFPKGIASDHIHIKLNENIEIKTIESKLKNIPEITLK